MLAYILNHSAYSPRFCDISGYELIDTRVKIPIDLFPTSSHKTQNLKGLGLESLTSMVTYWA